MNRDLTFGNQMIPFQPMEDNLKELLTKYWCKRNDAQASLTEAQCNSRPDVIAACQAVIPVYSLIIDDLRETLADENRCGI